MVALVLVALILSAHAEPPCEICPDGYNDDLAVYLHAYTDDLGEQIADWASSVITGVQYNSSRTLRKKRYRVDSIQQWKARMLEAAHGCHRIRVLHVIGHGQPNDLHLDMKGARVSAANLIPTLKGLDCAMAPGAVVHFTSCNLGRSCEGEDFMRAVAGTLLTKGGGVRAATSLDTTVGFSTNLSPQYLHVDAGLENLKWQRPPEDCGMRQSADISVGVWRDTIAGCRNIKATDNPDFLAIKSFLEFYDLRRTIYSADHLSPELMANLAQGDLELQMQMLLGRYKGIAGVDEKLKAACASGLGDASRTEENHVSGVR